MTPAEIAETMRLHAMWMRGESGGVRADLTGAVLSGANLTGAVLSGANLTGAVLPRAVLRYVVLTSAALRYADFTGADLTGALLPDADLTRAALRGVRGYVVGPQRSDGHRIDLTLMPKGWCVVAGCLTPLRLTLDDYEARALSGRHGYDDAAKREETLTIIQFLRARLAQMQKRDDA